MAGPASDEVTTYELIWSNKSDVVVVKHTHFALFQGSSNHFDLPKNMNYIFHSCFQ